MHIHGAHMNPNPSLGSSQTAALAARRAEETRKKLFSGADEIDATSSSESAWMISAWGGQGGGQGSASQNPYSQPQSHTASSEDDAEDLPQNFSSSGSPSYATRSAADFAADSAADSAEPAYPRRQPSGPVSYWA